MFAYNATVAKIFPLNMYNSELIGTYPYQYSRLDRNVNPNGITAVDGDNGGDYIGNQMQFNFLGTKLLVPNYAKNVTSIIDIVDYYGDLNSAPTVPIRFGAAADYDFNVICSFGPGSDNTICFKNSDGTYTASTHPFQNTEMDNWCISPSGNYASDETGVYFIDQVKRECFKFHAVRTRGFYFSEDDKSAVSIGENGEIQRWKINGLVISGPYSTDLRHPYVSIHNSVDGYGGCEMGCNGSLSRVAYMSESGVVVMGFNYATWRYEELQVLNDGMGTGGYGISMDRAGHVLTYAFLNEMPQLPVYVLRSSGKFELSTKVAALNVAAKYSAKPRLSPIGDKLAIDAINYSADRGRIRVHNLYYYN